MTKFNINRILLVTAFLMQTSMADESPRMLIIAPLYGYHYNKEIHTKYPMGMPKTVSTEGSGYQTGFFLQAVMGRFYIIEYPFYARANHSDVLGNVLFVSCNVWEIVRNFQLNIGLGHVYHIIKSPGNELSISLPMPKIGLKFTFGPFRFNPYISRTRELTTVEAGGRSFDHHYDYNLYGLNIDYSYHHFWNHTLKYYFGDVAKKDGNNLFTIRYYTYLSLSRTIGIAVKYEYEKHKNKAWDKSFTIGPFFVF